MGYFGRKDNQNKFSPGMHYSTEKLCWEKYGELDEIL